MYSINSANIHTWQMGSDSQVASIPTFPHQILFLTENQLNRVQNRNSGSLQSLTVGQCQRLLQLLQVIGSLCDHHTDCILMCDIFVPMEFISGPVSQELPICLIWHPSYGPQHVSVDPQHLLPV